MADIPQAYIKKGVQQYSKQLLTTRALAYHQHVKHMMGDQEGVIPPDVKRGMAVQRVARLVFTNMMTVGTESPLIELVREKIRKDLGEDLEFYYPPGSLDLTIYRKVGNTKLPLSRNETTEITNRAWQLTLRTVDEFMFGSQWQKPSHMRLDK